MSLTGTATSGIFSSSAPRSTSSGTPSSTIVIQPLSSNAPTSSIAPASSNAPASLNVPATSNTSNTSAPLIATSLAPAAPLVSSTTPSSFSRTPSMSDVLLLLSQLSPSSQRRVSASLAASSTSSTATTGVGSSGSLDSTTGVGSTSSTPQPSSTVLNPFITNIEGPASTTYSTAYRQIPPQLMVLLNKCVYLPLTLFCNEAWKRMHLVGSSIVYVKRPDPLGGKAENLMLMEQFGDEGILSQELWAEAWRNYLLFLHTLPSPHSHSRWRLHFDWITSQSDFRTLFTAYRHFDISE